MTAPALDAAAQISQTNEVLDELTRPRVPSFTYVTEWPLSQGAVLVEAKGYAEAEFRFRLDVLRGVGYRILTRPTTTVLHGTEAKLRMECVVTGLHPSTAPRELRAL